MCVGLSIFSYWRSKALLLLWTFIVIYVLCLSCCLVCPLQPCGHLLGLVSWFSCMWCFLVLWWLSHVLSRVRFGTWLHRFLIFVLFLITHIMSWHPSKIVYFSEWYSQSVYIQISIPAISSTTTSVSELTIIRVWLPVKEARTTWTNIWVSYIPDCIRLTFPYCKLKTIPSPL